MVLYECSQTLTSLSAAKAARAWMASAVFRAESGNQTLPAWDLTVAMDVGSAGSAGRIFSWEYKGRNF